MIVKARIVNSYHEKFEFNKGNVFSIVPLVRQKNMADRCMVIDRKLRLYIVDRHANALAVDLGIEVDKSE